MGYILRVLAAFGLLSLTYNPTQYNFARWAEANWSAQMPLAVLFGLLLLVGYIIYLRATLRSIGAEPSRFWQRSQRVRRAVGDLNQCVLEDRNGPGQRDQRPLA